MIRYCLALSAAAMLMASAILLSAQNAYAQSNAPRQSGAINAAIAQALYAASATQAASERQADERSAAQRRRIARLDTNLQTARQRAENNATEAQAAQAEAERLATQLAEAQQNYVADLEERDEAFARQIELFRSAVVDVASTPEGLEALRRFNEGDWPGARSILEDLNAAIDRGENIERAARYRSTAEIYYEAYTTGQESAEPVIALYEDIVALDPNFASDWVRLMLLFGNTQRYDEMAVAIERAREADGDPWIASILDTIPTDLIRARDEDAFMDQLRSNVVSVREELTANPDRIEPLIGLIGNLYALARLETFGSGIGSAAEYIDELGTLLEENRAILRSNEDLNFIAVESDYLALAAQLSSSRGEIEQAVAEIDRSIALRREILADEPNSVQRRQEFFYVFEVKANIEWDRGEYASAIASYREAVPLIAAFRIAGRNLTDDLIGIAERLMRVSTRANELGMDEDAQIIGEQSLETARLIRVVDPDNPAGHTRLADALLRNGSLAYRLNGGTGSEPLLEEALAFADELVENYPGSLEARRLGWFIYGGLADMSYEAVNWRDVIERVERDREAGLIDQGGENLLTMAREQLSQPEE